MTKMSILTHCPTNRMYSNAGASTRVSGHHASFSERVEHQSRAAALIRAYWDSPNRRPHLKVQLWKHRDHETSEGQHRRYFG
jgi:hypothetical protein